MKLEINSFFKPLANISPDDTEEDDRLSLGYQWKRES